MTGTGCTWSYNIRHALCDIGCNDIFDLVTPCDIDFAENALSDLDSSEWDIRRYKSDKLRYYNLHKFDKSTEEYIRLNVPRYHRSILAQFRCGILPLEIEVGRYRNAELTDRICQLCSTAIEDEVHFLCECPLYSDYRSQLFHAASQVETTFMNMDKIEQFTFLMSNLQKLVAKFLTHAMSRRTHRLTKVTLTNEVT